MTYNVFGGTLSLTQSINLTAVHIRLIDLHANQGTFSLP